MNQLTQTCLICQSKTFSHFCTKRGQEYIRCNQCAHVCVKNHPAENEIIDYYKGRKSHHSSGEKETWDYSRIKAEFFYDPLLNKIRHFTDLGRLLDIGCSNGSFVFAAQQKGWAGCGIELERSSYEVARNHGINVYTTELSEQHFPDNYFHAVTMWQVVEHLSDPKTLLMEISRILKPNGIFALSTPNIRSIAWYLLKERWAIIEPEVHLNLFTPDGLQRLMKSCGLITKQIETLDIKPLTIKTLLNTNRDESSLKISSSIPNLAAKRSPTQMKLLFYTRQIANLPLRIFGMGEDIFGYFSKKANY